MGNELLTHLREYLQRFTFLWVGAALVVVAALVNRFAPKSRPHIRRSLTLFGLYAFSLAVAFAMNAVGAHVWGGRVAFVAALLEAFTLVSLGGLVVFDLALPAVRVDLVSITSDVVLGIVYVVTGIAVARAAGMDPSAVVATSAVVSGVLAISMQATIGNILGGVALQLDGSIHVGDWLQLTSGKQGKVKEIRWRHTVIETRDWDTIVVPNASLLATDIIILGKREGQPVQHRMWVYFNVDFRYPPQKVVDIVQDALRAAPIPNVAMDPPPNCICYDFAKDGRDSFGYYAVRYWLTDLAVDDPTSSAVRTRVFAALRRADIPLARPAQTLFVTPDDESQIEQRVVRHRGRRMKALTTVSLFKGLTNEELEYLADHLLYAPFVKGETVTRQGAVAHWLYILTSGEVEIRMKLDTGVSRTVAHVKAPGFFGEMGLMTGEPRTADVIALTDVECYRLDKEGFERILQERPEIATGLSQNMAKRRVELLSAREDLDEDARRRREASEQARILARIQDFFGLS